MSKIKKGETYVCDVCGKQSPGRFTGAIDSLHPPKKWLTNSNGIHCCSIKCSEIYKKEVIVNSDR